MVCANLTNSSPPGGPQLIHLLSGSMNQFGLSSIHSSNEKEIAWQDEHVLHAQCCEETGRQKHGARPMGLPRTHKPVHMCDLSAPFCTKGLSVLVMTHAWPSEVIRTHHSLILNKHTLQSPSSLFGDNRHAQNTLHRQI